MGVVDGNKEHALKIEEKVQLPHDSAVTSNLARVCVPGCPEGAKGVPGTGDVLVLPW